MSTEAQILLDLIAKLEHLGPPLRERLIRALAAYHGLEVRREADNA